MDARGWGWMSGSYVSDAHTRPFWNRAKELLFSGKQVTSFTIGAFDPDLYCEVRKHYGFVWFEMQHSTMSWDEVAKMIAACPGPDGAAPFIRMPDQQESSIQKATDLGRDRPDLPDDPRWAPGARGRALRALSADRPPQLRLGAGRPRLARRARRLPEHVQRQHARRRDARDSRWHRQRGRDRQHVRRRRGDSGQQRSLALLRDGRRPTRGIRRS